MLVNNIFASIQGESVYSGYPTTFVRFVGCNLRCNYCDTKYAYETGKKLNIAQIIEQVIALENIYVCLTGGEPLLQKDIQKLINELVNRDYRLSIETNGTIALDNFNLDSTKIVMDFKLPGSREYEDNLDQIHKNLNFLQPKDDLKFVVATKKDFQIARDIIVEEKLQNKTNIIFSPVFSRLQPQLLVEWLLADSDLDKCRLQLQLHKIIWDEETTGV